MAISFIKIVEFNEKTTTDMKIQSKMILNIILLFILFDLQKRFSVVHKKISFSKLKEFKILRKKVRVLP